MSGAGAAGASSEGRTTSEIGRDAVRLEPILHEHRDDIEAVLRGTGFFREDEIVVALEVVDSYLEHPDRDYSAVGAFTPGGKLVGYVCYGPTPCATGTWDLYWIAVSTELHNAGVGTLLLLEVERRLARTDARLVIIETSSQPLYEPTRQFYLRRGYDEVARVPDFYAEGDDRVVFAKRIQTDSRG